MAMSPVFISDIENIFPNAHLTFDNSRIVKIINEAVDKVRRQDQIERPELLRTRYIWLINLNSLKPSQSESIAGLTVKKLNFQELFNQPAENAEAYLKNWYFWASHSRLEPIKEAAYNIKRHWTGVFRWFQSGINNGILEGIDSFIQAAKTRARGYRTIHNLITMIYLIGGKLNFGTPT